MKVGDKAQFSQTAAQTLTCVHGSASVLTITGIAAGIVFLRQDWTRSEFMASKSDIVSLAPDDAEIQTLIYQARMDEVTRKRTVLR